MRLMYQEVRFFYISTTIPGYLKDNISTLLSLFIKPPRHQPLHLGRLTETDLPHLAVGLNIA
jgi:hypothetical protein